MKTKLILALIATSIIQMSLFAQATLPSFYPCEAATPQGYTLDLGTDSLYAAATSCEGSGSLRFNNEGENLIVHTASQPTSIAFLTKGVVGQADFWNGSFYIEESIDAQDWIIIDSIAGQNALPLGTCEQRSFIPQNPESRYIRLIFMNKLSGDDIVNGGGNVNVDSIYIDGSTITSLLNNTNEKNYVQLFPNPSEGIFNLSSTAAMNRIQIFNSVGGLLLDAQLPNLFNYSFSLEQFKEGIYWIEVSGNGMRSTHKTIKL